jgi:tetratricopeptide (TPR) repeat protein
MAPTRAVRRSVAAAILVAFWLPALSARAAGDNDSLRRQALALNDVTGNLPIEGQILALTEKPARARQLLTLALETAKGKDQPFRYNAAYILARTALALKESEAGRTFFRLCAEDAIRLRSGERLLAAYDGLANVIEALYAEKKYVEGVGLCREILAMFDQPGIPLGFKSDGMRLLVNGLVRQGKLDEAERLVDAFLRSGAHDWEDVELKGLVLQEKGNYEAAAQVYEKLLQRVGQEKTLTPDQRSKLTAAFRYRLSGVYTQLKQIDKAAAHLQALLAESPDDPTYNNDLGFLWADNDRNLAEAERLIRKAIAQDRAERRANPDRKSEDDKDNAAYLDSLGWVLFKQQRYQDALPYLAQAAEDPTEGQFLEIYDHLGDVYLALGETAEAVAAWKKGLTLPLDGKREQERKSEVEKKVRLHQP